jgi:hypothetical protein
MNKYTQIVKKNILEYGFKNNSLANSMAISIVRDVLKAVREEPRERRAEPSRISDVERAVEIAYHKLEGLNGKGPKYL